MKKLLLGITLLAIIFIAVLCKPIDGNANENTKPSGEMNLEARVIQNNKK